MGIPHGFFHFISSEGRNGEWPRGDRSPRSRPPPGREPGVAAESRRSPCDLLTSGKGPPAARVYSVLEVSRNARRADTHSGGTPYVRSHSGSRGRQPGLRPRPEEAIKLAGLSGGKLRVITIVDSPLRHLPDYAVYYNPEPLREAALKAADDVLAKAREKVEASNVEGATFDRVCRSAPARKSPSASSSRPRPAMPTWWSWAPMVVAACAA